MLPRHLKRPGFTLIELLIVVAIIAILAAIAVPNFLEAQTRSKVSRAKSDMRTIATAEESYAVDDNNYRPDQLACQVLFGLAPAEAQRKSYSFLTTPISYLTTIPNNVFPNETDNPGAPKDALYRYFGEFWREGQINAHPGDPAYNNATPYIWSLASSGPNRRSNLGEYLIFGVETFEQKFPNGFAGIAGPTCIYDPSNGTISEGDVVRLGPGGPTYP